MSDNENEAIESVWDAIADTPADAVNLRLRSELMERISALVAERGWSQRQAAEQCGLPQPRMNDLLRRRISRFSLNALVNIATALGLHVHLSLAEVLERIKPRNAPTA